KPLLAVLVSFTGAFLIIFTNPKRQNLRESWTFIAAFIKFGIVLSMIPVILHGKVIKLTLIEIAPGLSLMFKVDFLGIIFGLVASGLWIVTSLYSIGYMRGLKEHAQNRYFFAFALCLSATMGIAFAGNLLTFYVFYEMLTVSTYPLVTHNEDEEAVKAGRKYLTYTLSAGVLLLFAIAATYLYAGTLEFMPGGFLNGHNIPIGVLQGLLVAFLIGCGVKAGVMPFHAWLPSAMVAPTPVSALLHAVAVVKAGVFGCVRIIAYVFGPVVLKDIHMWLIVAYFVSFTIIVSSLFALASDNLKRRLAFSTISQLSYVILGAALLSKASLTGAILHIPNHAYMKITLFFCAGAIFVKTGKKNISELDGIGWQMPITMGAFTIVTFGIVGIPPSSGFVSKWYLCLGTLQAREIFFLFVLLTSSVLNAAYYFPIVYAAFFRQPAGGRPAFNEASLPLVIPLSITAIFALIFGIFPNFIFHFFDLARNAATTIIAGM
ncbi:MAG: monovalent cation/H+ antiporter subunit D family protein, partial [Nitrospiraceae bacterium]|nr:monovalent cation/H+ antiporter subunit D family protein [Nitrospiraceae bacterium]